MCGTVIDCEPGGDVNPQSIKELMEVCCPCDRHRNIADGIFDDKVPPNDPGDNFAECRIGVCIRTSRDRHEGGKLGITKGAEPARNGGDDEREHHSGTCPKVTWTSGRGSTDDCKDSGADYRTDTERDKINGAEGALQVSIRRTLCIFSNEVEGLSAKDMDRHSLLRYDGGSMRNSTTVERKRILLPKD
ncbi:MAG: hypothetical protein HW389_1951 [Bacteroidetes bacterium]|nr:hypothetical protein [Bacteroidota bacterium]